MVDSTAAYELDAGTPSYSAINGVRPVGERGVRAASQQSDDLAEAGPDHASALLTMGALKQEAGAYGEAEELFRRALDIGERSLGRDNPALIPAVTSLVSALVMCGKLDDAQELAVRASALSENGPAEQESDVAILINDLARVCLKQSAYGVAEPLLLRLFAMKRSKGEHHPEVGTVLASLGTVRQALGRHESAEQLWRRVLEIRERTLAPNHFAIATALEHLAESCAARGKIGEALQLFQRALSMRELTLGAGHPSLRIARDRIADLQLQAGESLDTPADTPAPAPEKYRLLSANPGGSIASLISDPPPVRERPAAPKKGTARVVEPEPIKSEPIKAEPVKSEPVKQEAPPAPVVATMPAVAAPLVAPVMIPTATEVPPAKTESAPYRDLIMSIQQEMDDEAGAASAAPFYAGFVASIGAALRQRQKETLIAVGVVATLALLATATRAWTEPDQPLSGGAASFEASRPVTSVAAPGTSSHAVVPASNPATVAAAATPVTESHIRVADSRPAVKKPAERRTDAPAITIPKALTAGFESVVRVPNGSERLVGEPFAVQTPLAMPASRGITYEREDPAGSPNAARRAQLIGSLPVPKYPVQLVDVQGEVRVRFDVDALGRPTMSSASVTSSPHALLTAAVLKVIPEMRFEPARTAGPDAKPVADVVQLTFQFRTTK